MKTQSFLYQTIIERYNHEDYANAKMIILELFDNFGYDPELGSPEIYFMLGNCFINEIQSMKDKAMLSEAIASLEVYNLYNRLKYQFESIIAKSLINECNYRLAH